MSLTGTKGGAGVWQRIISEMPEHDVYIEPFWGRGTIARKKRPARNTIGVDMDPDAISDGDDVATMFLADGIQWLADYFKLLLPLLDATQDPASGAGRPLPLLDATENPAAQAPDARISVPAGNSVGGPPLETATQDPAATARDETFGGVSGSRHFVYIDPPYLGFSGYYKHELTVDRHRILCRLFRHLPAPAALSGYHSELLDVELDGCRQIEIPTVNRAGKRCVEVLWMNYPEPARYHDVRFVGKDRRERERIHRRVKTWSNGLQRMEPRERQAVFEACAAVYQNAVPDADRLSP